MPQDDPIQIARFWDKNPLVMPWMEQFLPVDRMWQDCFATVVGIFVAGAIAIAFIYLFLPQNVVTGIIGVAPSGYLLGSLNNRMARAQRKFFQAKRDAARSGNSGKAA
ncbi:hypothetical protein [Mesorhizobium sp. B2-3-4]|uniref:hypothetical protein n=1 Tax=Mesorhizobium sp. B2-3-4 TaxID=2589959 RepID=UPI00112CEDC9|nr:hypothetical protein [Mesorhizobium sp. B2-3-4]TPM36200.1 hypothetical protein FJ967_19105 [Mesorhizobium sp. B2-3-4]